MDGFSYGLHLIGPRYFSAVPTPIQSCILCFQMPITAFLLDVSIFKGDLSSHIESHQLGFMYPLIAPLSAHLSKLSTSKLSLSPSISAHIQSVSKPIDFILYIQGIPFHYSHSLTLCSQHHSVIENTLFLMSRLWSLQPILHTLFKT